MEDIKNCLVCGNSNFILVHLCRDFVASAESFQIQKCVSCGFVFTNPRPAIHEIDKYYKTDKYISHAENKSGLIYRVYDVVRNYSIGRKLHLIKKYHKDGTLLDLGCGLGYFLNGVKQDATFDGTGVDVSEEALSFIRKQFDLHVKNDQELDTFPVNHFDIITQWHVLEHVHLLNERMVQLKHLIKPGGTLFIAVPNSDSFDSKYYKQYWDAFDVPRHLYHFNRSAFAQLMDKHHFEIVEIRPLFFDAPYVSMRSEQHQKHSLSFLRGGFIGLLSNLLAIFSKNYSSLLFVVKNKI